VMAIHQPNSGKIWARLFFLEDTGDALLIQGELPLE